MTVYADPVPASQNRNALMQQSHLVVRANRVPLAQIDSRTPESQRKLARIGSPSLPAARPSSSFNSAL